MTETSLLSLMVAVLMSNGLYDLTQAVAKAKEIRLAIMGHQ